MNIYSPASGSVRNLSLIVYIKKIHVNH